MTELVRDFLDPGDFYRAVRNIGISFFCGVPDSLLKGNTVTNQHIFQPYFTSTVKPSYKEISRDLTFFHFRQFPYNTGMCF